MKKEKSFPHLRTSLLISALVSAGLLSPAAGSATTLVPLAKSTKPTLTRPVAAPKKVAAKPVVRTPLAKAPVAKKPVAANLPAGGQLVLQTRNGLRLTSASLSHLSQIAGKRLTVAKNYGEGEYVLTAHGAVGVNALRTVASKLKTNSSILHANPYVAEAALQYPVISGKTYVLMDPKVARPPAMRTSVLTLKPKQVLGAPVPVRAISVRTNSLKAQTAVPAAPQPFPATSADKVWTFTPVASNISQAPTQFSPINQTKPVTGGKFTLPGDLTGAPGIQTEPPSPTTHYPVITVAENPVDNVAPMPVDVSTPITGGSLATIPGLAPPSKSLGNPTNNGANNSDLPATSSSNTNTNPVQLPSPAEFAKFKFPSISTGDSNGGSSNSNPSTSSSPTDNCTAGACVGFGNGTIIVQVPVDNPSDLPAQITPPGSHVQIVPVASSQFDWNQPFSSLTQSQGNTSNTTWPSGNFSNFTVPLQPSPGSNNGEAPLPVVDPPSDSSNMPVIKFPAMPSAGNTSSPDGSSGSNTLSTGSGSGTPVPDNAFDFSLGNTPSSSPSTDTSGQSSTPTTGAASDPSAASAIPPAPAPVPDSTAGAPVTTIAATPADAAAAQNGTPDGLPGVVPINSSPADNAAIGAPGAAEAGMMGGMGPFSVKKGKTTATRPVLRVNYLTFLRQNRVIGYHLTTIDKSGIAHGRYLYLQVKSAPTTAAKKLVSKPATPSAKTRVPVATVKKVARPIAKTPPRTVTTKPVPSAASTKHTVSTAGKTVKKPLTKITK